MTNVLAVAVDAQLVTRISRIRGHRLVSISRDNLTAVRDVSFVPDLILVGSGLSALQALEYARGVLASHPEMVVVLVAEPDRELVRAATQLGVRGVIRSSINDRELSRLLERAAVPSTGEPNAIAGEAHQVIVVASPKGGVGKTTIAVNLAALLAEQAPGEVVLLDLDLQFGDISTLLDLQPQFTVATALNSPADSMLLRTLLVPHPANFYVLCGANHPAEAGPVNGGQIRKLVNQFASHFRYVVIDTSAGLQEETLASLEEATDVAFVATLDVATLRNVRKEVDVLAELGLLPEHRRVILNRTDRLSGLTAGDAESIIGLPVDAAVPVSSNVPLAANHALLAVELKRRNTVRRPLGNFAQLVSARSRAVDRPRKQPKRSHAPGRHR
jgi:pilus assembly protein CpaE